MPKVIVNSTPLIALSKVGRLDILRQMYGRVTVPGAVFQEVTVKNDTVRKEILDSEWIDIEAVPDLKDRKMYSAKLHAGEVEVMILAQKMTDHLVVIDDRAARKTAEFLGLKLTGTLGVLLKAKANGLIPKVMPIIECMEAHEIFLSQNLQDKIRKLCGE